MDFQQIIEAVGKFMDLAAVLAVIVLIRTFLSFSLELEITGRWPWQNAPAGTPRTDASAPPAQTQ